MIGFEEGETTAVNVVARVPVAFMLATIASRKCVNRSAEEKVWKSKHVNKY
jgi:hypothetical protein